jgi:sugar phosphate isomerase/epimerase
LVDGLAQRAPSFGLSTHLYQGQRLNREHLREIAAAGFRSIELCATRTHVDYHHDAPLADLQQWLAEAGLALASVHAPVAESYVSGRWGPALNLASPDADRRELALDEATRALHIARRLPFATFVVHAGIERLKQQGPGENSRDAARRSIDALVASARPLGVTIAVELIPNELSTSTTLVHFVEDVLESGAVGICLDMGHAQLEGDLGDAIDAVSEHIVAVHAHDNRGRTDDHLVPFEGSIDWPAAMTGLQKVGYEGLVMIEVRAGGGTTTETLVRARQARVRLERLLATM